MTVAAMPSGRVIWITGLSGAGKTTVGGLVVEAMRARGQTVVWLDGDRLRDIMGAGTSGFDEASRRRLAGTYGRLCREVADQGVDVVCTTVSMFHEVRQWNRDNIAGYFEIYLRVPLDELCRRDPKGHYRASDAMVGIHLAAEEPATPDLVIDNYGTRDAGTAAGQIILALEAREKRTRP
ncbi:MAG TPA: adenylyl-sulfate kinase [Magnetospirillum sp.]|nr:adenylyl-sulfate kinase [Magnetospirillum sp.]